MPKKINVLDHTNRTTYTTYNPKEVLQKLDEARTHIQELEKAYNDLLDWVLKTQPSESVADIPVNPRKLDKLPSKSN